MFNMSLAVFKDTRQICTVTGSARRRRRVVSATIRKTTSCCCSWSGSWYVPVVPAASARQRASLLSWYDRPRPRTLIPYQGGRGEQSSPEVPAWLLWLVTWIFSVFQLRRIVSISQLNGIIKMNYYCSLDVYEIGKHWRTRVTFKRR